MTGYYRRYCREFYSKTVAQRIVSAKLVILDAPILQKPLRLFYIGLNRRCFKPLQCQQHLFHEYSVSIRWFSRILTKMLMSRSNHFCRDGDQPPTQCYRTMETVQKSNIRHSCIRDCAKNPTFVILNPPSPPYQGGIEWKVPLIRGI